MKCKNCGNKLEKKQTTCRYCGEEHEELRIDSLASDSVAMPDALEGKMRKHIKGALGIGSVVVVAVVVAVVVGYGVYFGASKLLPLLEETHPVATVETMTTALYAADATTFLSLYPEGVVTAMAADGGFATEAEMTAALQGELEAFLDSLQVVVASEEAEQRGTDLSDQFQFHYGEAQELETETFLDLRTSYKEVYGEVIQDACRIEVEMECKIEGMEETTSLGEIGLIHSDGNWYLDIFNP